MRRMHLFYAILLALSCCQLAGGAPSPKAPAPPSAALLAEADHVGGLTVFGVGEYYVRLYEDGTLYWYDQSGGFPPGTVRKESPSVPTPLWRTVHVPLHALQPLKTAIARTNFSSIEWNRTAMRPSAADGCDVTMRFRTARGMQAVPLWQVTAPAHLEPVERLQDIERRYAHN